MHQEVAALGGADQATDRGLPLVELLIGLRKLVDVNASIQRVMSWRPPGSGIGLSNGRFQPRSATVPRRADVGAAMIAHGAKHPGLQISKGHVVGKAASVDLGVDSPDCCSRRTRGFARGSAYSRASPTYRAARGSGWSMASPKTRAESPTSQAARGCVVTSKARKRPRPGTSQRRLTRGIRENPVAARVQRRARQTRQHSLTGAVVKCEFHTSAAWRQAWP